MIRVGPPPGGVLSGRVRANLAAWRAAETRRREDGGGVGIRARLASFRRAASVLSPRVRARKRQAERTARHLNECADFADNLLDAVCDAAQYGLTDSRRSLFGRHQDALSAHLLQPEIRGQCPQLVRLAMVEDLEALLHSVNSIALLATSRRESHRLRERASELTPRRSGDPFRT